MPCGFDKRSAIATKKKSAFPVSGHEYNRREMLRNHPRESDERGKMQREIDADSATSRENSWTTTITFNRSPRFPKSPLQINALTKNLDKVE